MKKESRKDAGGKDSSRILRSPLLWIIVVLIVGALGYDFVRPNLTTNGLYEQIEMEMQGIYLQDAKAVEKVFRLCNKIVGKSIVETKKAKAYRLLSGFDPATGALLEKPRMEMLLKAADSGDSDACEMIGKAYMYGRDGLACDPEKGIAYLGKSESDNAKTELAVYYMRQNNYNKAYEFLKEYDNELQRGIGLDLKQDILGLLYYYGLGGVTRNLETAEACFAINAIPLGIGRMDSEPERSDYDDLQTQKLLCCGNLQLSPLNLGYITMTDNIDGGGFVAYIYSARNFYAQAVRLGAVDYGRLLAVLDSFLDRYEEYMRDGEKITEYMNNIWDDRFLTRTGKILGTSASYWGELKNDHPDGWGIVCTYNNFERREMGSVTIGQWKSVFIRERFGGLSNKTVGASVRSEISKDGNVLTIAVNE